MGWFGPSQANDFPVLQFNPPEGLPLLVQSGRCGFTTPLPPTGPVSPPPSLFRFQHDFAGWLFSRMRSAYHMVM